MSLEIRTITDAEVPAFRDTLMTTFGTDVDADAGGEQRFRHLIAPGQAWAAFDRGNVVATSATFNLDIGVPGGSLPIAGLTMVTVRPSHRRRGILKALIKLHLDDARARNLGVSGLWASEASIYRRFGYGIAAEGDAIEIKDATAVTVAGSRELDELEWLDEERARQALPAVYARATATRPGVLRRSEPWWRERRFLETISARGGASKRRHVLARRGDELVGYIAYRQRGGFTDGVPSGKAEIIELVGVDPRAEATLWRFALSLDLFPHVTWWNAPTDDPLVWLVDNPRRIKRVRTDTLWLRIEDVPAALSARTYAGDGTLRFAVDDATWEVVVEAGRAHVTPTTGSAQLRLDRATLASLYLGCASASQLARAELVHGDAAAIATADRVFASATAPWCPEVF